VREPGAGLITESDVEAGRPCGRMAGSAPPADDDAAVAERHGTANSAAVGAAARAPCPASAIASCRSCADPRPASHRESIPERVPPDALASIPGK